MTKFNLEMPIRRNSNASSPIFRLPALQELQLLAIISVLSADLALTTEFGAGTFWVFGHCSSLHIIAESDRDNLPFSIPAHPALWTLPSNYLR
jgi:hypothetical protein